MKLETIAVHGGFKADPTTKAVAVPIYQTTSYAFDDTQHGADLFDLKVQGNLVSEGEIDDWHEQFHDDTTNVPVTSRATTLARD